VTRGGEAWPVVAEWFPLLQRGRQSLDDDSVGRNSRERLVWPRNAKFWCPTHLPEMAWVRSWQGSNRCAPA